MKINKKLIAPALTLVGLMAMGVGTTYALFTSNAETDTVISAGKVEYAQTAEDLTTYSGVDITGDPAVDVLAPTTVNGTFTLGGSASYESGVITLNKMTPGDKVTFTLKVKNSSNVTSKFRVYREITEDTGLFDGLKVKVNGEDWDGTTAYSAWVAKDGVSATEEVKSIEVSIELPTDKGNEFENKTCKIRFGMDAVQGNAKVSNPMSIYNGETFVEDAFDLKAALNSCKSTGYTLKLNEDIDLRKWAPIDGWGSTAFNIDGQGHKISGAVISDVDNGGLFGAVTGAMTVKNVTFEGFNVTTNIGKQKYAGVFVGKTYSPITFDNVTVTDCKISNTWQCGGLVGFGEYTTVTYKDCLVEDCFFGGNNATAGTLFGLGTTDVVVTDCEAKNVMLYTDSLDWNSTAKAKGHFAVGHLYTNTLTDTNYVETNVKVYLADGFALNKAGEYEVSNAAGLVYFGNQVDTGKTYSLKRLLN